MKNTRRLIAMILAVVCFMSLGFRAMAESADNNTEPQMAQQTVSEVVAQPEEEKSEIPQESGTPQETVIETPAPAPAVPAKDELTVHITNILCINPRIAESSKDGHAVPYNVTKTISKNGTKSLKGFNSTVKVSNGAANGFGCTYTFIQTDSSQQGVYVKATGSPVTGTRNDFSNGEVIKKISYKGEGKVEITYEDDSKETLLNTYEISISPAYTVKMNWYLNYRYIDNISTGSGSWSNRDGVTEFRHTFKKPASRSHYRFMYWKDYEENNTYNAGDTLVYNGNGLKSGETKNVTIYAVWQPSVTVRWHDEKGKIVKEEESFDETIGAYEFVLSDISLGEDAKARFMGWAVKDGEEITEGTGYAAPEATYEKAEPVIIDLYPVYETEKEVEIIFEDDDNRDGIRPESVTVELMKNGEATGKTKEISSGTASFTALEAFDSKGNQISYTVSEIVPEGYEAEKEETISKDTIKNIHASSKISIEGEKIWDDNDNNDGKRPESIRIVVKANGKDTAFSEVTEETNWMFSFTDLYEFEGGEKINYSLDEEEVAEYTATIEGYVVTNHHEDEKAEVTVKISWNDEGDRDGIRPEKVTIILYADGEEVARIEISSEDNWTKSFEGFNRYKAGKEIDYSISEAEIEGYETDIEGYDIMNTHTVEEEPAVKEDEEPEDPEPEVTDPQEPEVTEEEPKPEEVKEPGKKRPSKKTGNKEEPAAEEPEVKEEPEEVSYEPAVPAETMPQPLMAPVEEIITDKETPLANGGSWALMNLIMTVAGAIGAVMMAMTYFTKKDEEEIRNRHMMVRLVGILLSIVSVIAFLLTEDMRNPMVMMDKWTLLMAVLLGGELIMMGMSKKSYEDKEAEEV